jgi:hypothetical protein
MTLCTIGIHIPRYAAFVTCDSKHYQLGKQCQCGKKRVVDWRQAALMVSQVYTDGKMAQLIYQQKGEY